MKHARRYGISLAACAVLALPAPAAAATELPLPAASERAATHAKRTCDRDRSCTRHGVVSCRRQRTRVVLCRIFLGRSTEVQGQYRCTRQVRLEPVPGTRHAKVTGLGSWHC